VINEFKVGRRYQTEDVAYRCVAAFKNQIALQSLCAMQIEAVTPWLLQNTTELPPDPGEYYKGDEVEFFFKDGTRVCRTYIGRVNDEWSVITGPAWSGCPAIIRTDTLRRPAAKPKTIRRPPHRSRRNR
jgi:hypothetical protein